MADGIITRQQYTHDYVDGLRARVKEAEARAERAEAQLRSRDAEVYYLRLHREWAHDKRRQMASGAGVDAYQQWLAANPEPQPPEGVAP